MIKYHSTGTRNQFLFDGNRGVSACTPLCIQALYHLYEALHYEGKLLEAKHWQTVMQRGIVTWELWREKHQHLETRFPTVQEIVKMPECAGFYKLFHTEREECGGLIAQSKTIENVEGTLDRFVATLAKHSKIACAVIQLPIHSSVALLAYGNSIFLFDPHGSRDSNDILLVQFMNSKEVVPFLMRKYAISKYSNIEFSDIEEAQNLYGYSATLFTVK